MNDKKVVFLSPSAQEYNIGLGNFGSEEYRMNRIADIIEKRLIDDGYVVYRNNPNETLSCDVTIKKPSGDCEWTLWFQITISLSVI